MDNVADVERHKASSIRLFAHRIGEKIDAIKYRLARVSKDKEKILDTNGKQYRDLTLYSLFDEQAEQILATRLKMPPDRIDMLLSAASECLEGRAINMASDKLLLGKTAISEISSGVVLPKGKVIFTSSFNMEDGFYNGTRITFIDGKEPDALYLYPDDLKGQGGRLMLPTDSASVTATEKALRNLHSSSLHWSPMDGNLTVLYQGNALQEMVDFPNISHKLTFHLLNPSLMNKGYALYGSYTGGMERFSRKT